jgi:hypothetical protein
LHDLDTAEVAFTQASRDHPDAAAAFNNLANILAERGKFDDALTAAEQAVNLGGPLLPTTQATLDEIREKAEAAHTEQAKAQAAADAAAREAADAAARAAKAAPAPTPKAKQRKKRTPKN